MRLLIIFLIISLVSCHGSKHPVIKNGRTVTDVKELDSLAGTWYATPDTDTMLKKKNYQPDSIYIILQKDSVLKAHHLPDCITAATKGGLLQDAVGVWKLHRDGNDWKLGVAFEAGRLFRYKTHTSFDIAVVDSVLSIYQYIGDPKEGDVLQFRKSR